ncbi:AAA family ATPase [Mycoplasmatota bacterium]|nr:AAA family ATPase [Mycoplasmatota bacterium]
MESEVLNVKKLVIIHGPPGVGKTTVCKSLYKNVDRSVWLDADWCWMMNPFEVTDENKQMVVDNIIHLLRNFLNNSSLDYVIFCWVIHKEFIFDIILKGLSDLNFELQKITLTCSSESLRNRMENDNRTKHQINSSIESMKDYYDFDTLKIDTTEKKIKDVVSEIENIVVR